MTAIGVRVGGGGGPGELQPPQILGNSYFLGSKKKFWQSQVLKPFPRCLFYHFEEMNIFYFNLKKNPAFGIIIQLHSLETVVA